MKKFKILLALLLIFGTLLSVACTGEQTEASSEADSSAETSASKYSSTEYTKKIDSLLSDNNDRTLDSVNILKGLSYTLSKAAHSDYPDNGKLLTDGNKPGAFDESSWAGFYERSNKPTAINFDLGSVKNGIMDFHLTSLNQKSYGISLPRSVAVYIAGEDREFTLVGTAVPPLDISDNDAFTYSVMLQGAVSARYIRFEIMDGGSVWMFIGETSVTAYGEEYAGTISGNISGDDYYSYPGIPEIATPEYWPDTEADYNTEANLVSGVKPIITSGAGFVSEIATEWYNSTTLYQLTDGKLATKSSYGDGAWFHITRGNTRTITFDLGKTGLVTGFSAGFLRDSGAGIHLPRHLTVKLSENGKDWQTVYFEKSVTGNSEYCITRVNEQLDKGYKARYFQLIFTVNTHAYVDEITVNGKKNAKGGADIVADDPLQGGITGGGYITPDQFCGVNNMLLSYHCLTDNNTDHSESGLITPEEYLPYVAYLDEEGKVKDTFFDSYLYLPYTRFNYSSFAKSADGWRFYLDNMFHEGRNMDALDQCVGDVYAQLGINQKATVFTAVLYTFPEINGVKNNFGDIDGDGVDEDFSNINDRKKAIKWIMDEEYNRFQAKNYENLEFCGFYWFEEAINYSDPHEEELIAFAVDYAHKLGAKLLWIPYHEASGYSDWEELGFDLACMQPNYMFSTTATADIVYSTATQTQQLGMCVEIEITGPSNRNNATRYYEYLIAGAKTGYMNAVKIYYQDGVPGAFSEACYSEDPSVRRIYDDTYLFAKGKYEPTEIGDIQISTEPLSFDAQANRGLKGQIDLSEVKELGGKAVIAESPRYGTVRLNNDGSFIYTPAEDYAGTDSFKICVEIGNSQSEPISVTINIK